MYPFPSTHTLLLAWRAHSRITKSSNTIRVPQKCDLHHRLKVPICRQILDPRLWPWYRNLLPKLRILFEKPIEIANQPGRYIQVGLLLSNDIAIPFDASSIFEHTIHSQFSRSEVNRDGSQAPPLLLRELFPEVQMLPLQLNRHCGLRTR
jgi:hypothetical protein